VVEFLLSEECILKEVVNAVDAAIAFSLPLIVDDYPVCRGALGAQGFELQPLRHSVSLTLQRRNPDCEPTPFCVAMFLHHTHALSVSIPESVCCLLLRHQHFAVPPTPLRALACRPLCRGCASSSEYIASRSTSRKEKSSFVSRRAESRQSLLSTVCCEARVGRPRWCGPCGPPC
jgi:hypothetical protein